MTLADDFQRALPLVQAPMAGVDTPAMAAAVCEAGALGSIALGAVDAAAAGRLIADLRQRTSGPFNVNVFAHRPAQHDSRRERQWADALRPEFARFGAHPPESLRQIYNSIAEEPEKLRVILAARPAVVSFHFGLPEAGAVTALRGAGIMIWASVTSQEEARAAVAAGVDVLVAQGIEAGGHRGMFDPDAHDDALTTSVLVHQLARHMPVPVIAAGGIMDGAGIAAAMQLGAWAVQAGTAFIACTESAADAAYRAHLQSPAAHHTRMTRVISGRPARCLPNRFTRWGEENAALAVPDYPLAYAAGKALHAAAKAAGETGYGAQWAGQGAPLARPMPAGELVALLRREFEEC